MKEKKLIVSEALAGVQEKLYAMIYVLLEGSFDTMDVLQETNMAILRHAELYDPSRPALPWFKAFAMNQVLYYRRVRHDERLVFDSEMVNELADIIADEERISEGGGAETADLLEKCLAKLPPWQREILEERYQGGGKVNEMARKRLLSRVSLSVLMFRIRKVLQACIEGYARKASSSSCGLEAENAFVRSLEALLDGSATQAEKEALALQMRERSELKRVYVAHARLHALMRCRSGALFGRSDVAESAAETPVFRRAMIAAAAAAALVAAGWTVLRGAWPTKAEGIVAEAYAEGDEWLAQLTPLDMQAYRENMGFDALPRDLPPLQKYEPGSIDNPGAAIEIVEVVDCPKRFLLLAKGDRVWRERIRLDCGKMVFRLETGAQVTLFGPAEVQLHDEGSMTLVSGMVVAECMESPLRVTVREVSVQNRHVAFCLNATDGKRADVVVLSGTLQAAFESCGRVGHLAAGDGLRLLEARPPVRFRCLVSIQELKAKMFAGNSMITMQNRRRS